MNFEIKKTLRALETIAAAPPAKAVLRQLARDLAPRATTREEIMREFVGELHRRFVYAPDPIQEIVGFSWAPGAAIDVDDACLFVAALAQSAGIPCRIMGARYRERCWTCFVAYQDEEERWVGVNVLRQSATVPFEELALA